MKESGSPGNDDTARRADGRDPWTLFAQGLRYGGTAVLLAAVACFVVWSWRWRVVSDAALMHYVVFLQERGWVPYNTIHDINLPGAWLADWVVMRVRGGDLGWRVYDFGLMGIATAAMVGMTYRRDWFAGVFAGGLLALFHGRDGIGQAGQRDLAIAVLFLVAAASFQAAMQSARASQKQKRGRVALLLGCMGLALGAAATIKPFGLILFVLLLGWAILELRAKRRAAPAAALAGLGGFALPLLGMVLFLVHEHAWASFLAMCRVDLPYHAGAARPPFAGMVRAAFHPSILKLCVLPLVIFLLRRGWRDWQTRLLLLAFLFGLVCFFAQHKGYGYQRYPYLGFLLLWVGVECSAGMRAEHTWLRGLGAAGVLFGLCFCVPSYLRSIARAAWPEPYLQAMEQDLRLQGGDALQGRVQCIDSISGCVNVLYRMRLEQATGTIYDEFLFPAPLALTAGSVNLPQAIRQGQQQWMMALALHPPQVFLVSSWLFPEGPGDYGKLRLWPAFQQYLASNYRLADEQSFPRSENGPLGFRMYVRKPTADPEER